MYTNKSNLLNGSRPWDNPKEFDAWVTEHKVHGAEIPSESVRLVRNIGELVLFDCESSIAADFPNPATIGNPEVLSTSEIVASLQEAPTNVRQIKAM